MTASAALNASRPRVLLVCTGNVCRSPIAQHVLAAALGDSGLVTASAGLFPQAGQAMTEPARAIAVRAGAATSGVVDHRSREFDPREARTSDLIITMTRTQRRRVAELVPTRVRFVFTIRELAHLVDMPGMIASIAHVDPGAARLRAAVDRLSAARPLARIAEIDVVDPYGLGDDAYARCERELIPAVAATARLLQAAVDGAAGAPGPD